MPARTMGRTLKVEATFDDVCYDEALGLAFAQLQRTFPNWTGHIFAGNAKTAGFKVQMLRDIETDELRCEITPSP